MVHHSSFADDDGINKACGCPLLSLKTHIKGPAPDSDPDKADIVDETITFFRANVFFKKFHVKSPADKLLIYLTFYINIALKRLEGCRTLAVGTKAIINLGLEKVPVRGTRVSISWTFHSSPISGGSRIAEKLFETDKGGNKWKTSQLCIQS